MGMERLLMLMEAQGIEFPAEDKCDLYIASMGENATLKASQIAADVRGNGMHAQFDIVGRSVKAQMKYANKIGAAYTVVLGDSEIEAGVAKVKNMADGSETEMNIDDIAEEIMRLSINDSLKGFEVEGLDISSLM
jgi:histidyl-tRNA synthetase